MAAADATPGVTLNVNFTSSPDAFDAPAPGTKVRDLYAGIRPQLDAALVAAMNGARPALTAWLRANEENLTLFTSDPMTALKTALPDFDPALLARIAAIRAKSIAATPDLHGLKIATMTATVVPDATRK